MPSPSLAGRPGNLTAEQEQRLKELWLATFEVFGLIEGASSVAGTPRLPSAQSSPLLNPDSPNPNSKRKSRLSWFGKQNKGSPDLGSDAGSDAGGAEDKHGQGKDFKRAIANHSSESLRVAFWAMIKHDNPDAMMLRFLRARKWEVHDALVMMVSTLSWRAFEMKVDDEIMLKGEAGYLEMSKTGEGASKKDAADFISQVRYGKSFLHGSDKDGRPVSIVNARMHHPGQETEKSLEQFTVFIIETTRMMLRSPVDTATIVFDLSGFSMSNMDYTPVKFMIKCFEANYPESLGSVLVYKAPWIFQGVWKIIRGWLDPVVASKVHFCSDVSELSDYVEKRRVPKELGGEEDWTYKYVEPREGENAKMQDTTTRDSILKARKELSDEYEQTTIAWAKDGPAAARQNLTEQLRENYWRLDPYVRAISFYDRIGVIKPGGNIDFYPHELKPASTAQDRERKVESWATAPEKPIAGLGDLD